MTYASGTSVPVERSRAEIDRVLSKHGATSRGVMCDDLEGQAIVAFALSGRHYSIHVPLPRYDAFEMKKLPTRAFPTKRTPEQQRAAYEQACRERWRGVVLLLKAKLELVAMGVSTVEKEFLADLVLPGGGRLHDELGPAIADAYSTGRRLLPAAANGEATP